MTKTSELDENVVVPPEKVLDGASREVWDQVAVFGMRDGKFAIFSSHNALLMEDMVYDAIDTLFERPDDMLDPPE